VVNVGNDRNISQIFSFQTSHLLYINIKMKTIINPRINFTPRYILWQEKYRDFGLK